MKNTTADNEQATEIQKLLENKDAQIENLQTHIIHLKQLLSTKDGLIKQLSGKLEFIQMSLDKIIQESRKW